MATIENESLLITLQEKGAELTRIFGKQYSIEYLWDAKPEAWGKHSPVLFPIVGTLKNNSFIYKDKEYHLSRHGFARDKTFTVTAQSADAVSFTLRNDASTEQVYPFEFVFTIHYRITGAKLAVTYEVHNPSTSEMLYFSVGGHPAFRLPLEDGFAYDDYTLHFNKAEEAGRWPISADGLIETTPEPLLQNSNKLSLSKALFAKDALVLKGLQSDSVTLQSDKGQRGLQFYFPHFPFLGLWAAPGADFVCIEPWCGIADSVNHDQQLEGKEGIISLAAGQTFSVTWSVDFF